ncbi:hypothetical protein LF845_09355 [Deferribacterales bacterium Es71-Z0220]|uniref:hypothetical protein n=1 Tax=Deferrivibrio essentukiensis TaxID=2880922 RepID=UPI001F601A74|nr:hypothetical protein [Deferrivibrio essentukiensis]MBZ4672408.1 hypothetical protein [Deferribacteraceae bacterium]MCB4205163.1 hypothetical protein [Deferrivibrio essentukiensis]
MKIYKIDKIYIFLLVSLLVLSFFFGYSHTLIGGNNIKYFIIGFLILFIIFNLINLLAKEVEITDEFISIKSLTGVRKLNFAKIEDITPLKLKGRYIFIIADNEKYGFLSSMFDNFQEIFQIIKEKANSEIREKLSSITEKDFKSRKLVFVIFMLMANLFLLLASIYNLFTH